MLAEPIPITRVLPAPERMVVPVAPHASGGEITIIVDVANVMGARADGWWRDRAAAAARLGREVAALARRGLAVSEFPPGTLVSPGVLEAPGVLEVQAVSVERLRPNWVLVLEGRSRQAADLLSVQPASCGLPVFLADSDGRARLVLAPGSGDDTIVREVRELGGQAIVATADRELRGRCERAGAVVAGPGWLLRLL
jgi:8-oxo-dGTP diphosphatase